MKQLDHIALGQAYRTQFIFQQRNPGLAPGYQPEEPAPTDNTRTDLEQAKLAYKQEVAGTKAASLGKTLTQVLFQKKEVTEVEREEIDQAFALLVSDPTFVTHLEAKDLAANAEIKALQEKALSGSPEQQQGVINEMYANMKQLADEYFTGNATDQNVNDTTWAIIKTVLGQEVFDALNEYTLQRDLEAS